MKQKIWTSIVMVSKARQGKARQAGDDGDVTDNSEPVTELISRSDHKSVKPHLKFESRKARIRYVGLGASFHSSGAVHTFDSRVADSDTWEKPEMADWGPVLIGVVLFILLQPGLLFSLPGNGKQVEFGSMKTNGKAIAVHTLIFFALYAILILAVHVHIYTG
ncbi:hypothetical protein ACLB2K_061368 [Fragaria x ananassa]